MFKRKNEKLYLMLFLFWLVGVVVCGCIMSARHTSEHVKDAIVGSIS